MKTFALYLTPNDNPQFVEGDSAEVNKKPNGLSIVIKTAGKKKQTFTGVVLFCEVSEKIKLQ